MEPIVHDVDVTRVTAHHKALKEKLKNYFGSLITKGKEIDKKKK